MTPEEWQRLAPLLDAVLDAVPERRAEVIEELSGGDPARRRELERLLEDCERVSPLFDRPAAERFSALAPAPIPFPSSLADRYRMARELGRGGMATVYLARDLRHGRDVAVKLIHAELTTSLGRERFLREIAIAASLRHPHIVPLYDSGEADGMLYYVMPYEPGHSLRQRLASEGPLRVDEAMVILRDTCDALAHAHAHGVVHRDIKPDNVLLAGRHALVTDFGVAKALTAAGGDPVTQAGVTLGTPAYMAPEQIAGDLPVDHRADLYAVGVLAYEALAGKPPFTGDTPQKVLASHLAQAPASIRALRPDLPDVVADAVMKCLEKHPADRWQRAEELRALFESLNSGSGPAMPRRRGVNRAWARLANRQSGMRSVAAIIAVAAVAFAANKVRERSPALAIDQSKVVIVPFAVSGGDSSQRSLGENVVDLLSAKLTGEGGPLAVDSRTAISHSRRVTRSGDMTAESARHVARDVGAGEALLGSVGISGGRAVVTASLIPALAGDARPVAQVAGSVDSLVALVDQLAARLLLYRAGIAEPSLASLTSHSVPALRAYLQGRADYRRGHDTKAIDSYSRALELDSSFALAGLELAVATGHLLRLMGRASRTQSVYQPVGYQSSLPSSDHLRLTKALELAWRHRETLNGRDLPLLEALRAAATDSSAASARQLLAALERASTAAPDRADIHHMIGTLLLYQGPAMGKADSRTQAVARFQRALARDSAYLAPVIGLIDAAAIAGNVRELRRWSDAYLSRDDAGEAADYVRWRLAASAGDQPALRGLRAHFDSFSSVALHRIVYASQTTGVALEDADRAMELILRRAADPIERTSALHVAHSLALNRGRPREAQRILELMRDVLGDEYVRMQTALAALFWDGDSIAGATEARRRTLQINVDTTAFSPRDRRAAALSRSIAQQGLWDLFHGDTASAARAVRWLRRDRPLGADLVDVVLAAQRERPDAPAIRSRLDSVALQGCCNTAIVHWHNLIIAYGYEVAGDDAAALAAIRRGIWRYPPQLLSTFLYEEGRLAAKVGDRAGAIRAYRHYLALRSAPEPELRPKIDRVRAELARLEQAR